MRVRRIAFDYYEVREADGFNWWFVAKIPGGWMIVDLLGQMVSVADELGQQIVSAIDSAICTAVPCLNRAHYELKG